MPLDYRDSVPQNNGESLARVTKKEEKTSGTPTPQLSGS
jgi:hypothetical protein